MKKKTKLKKPHPDAKVIRQIWKAMKNPPTITQLCRDLKPPMSSTSKIFSGESDGTENLRKTILEWMKEEPASIEISEETQTRMTLREAIEQYRLLNNYTYNDLDRILSQALVKHKVRDHKDKIVVADPVKFGYFSGLLNGDKTPNPTWVRVKVMEEEFGLDLNALSVDWADMNGGNMKTIWKFTIDQANTVIKVPKGAKILTAREQRETICIWAEVDPEAETEERVFEIVGTGHRMQDKSRRYIGTASLQGGTYIFHVYEVG